MPTTQVVSQIKLVVNPNPLLIPMIDLLTSTQQDQHYKFGNQFHVCKLALSAKSTKEELAEILETVRQSDCFPPIVALIQTRLQLLVVMEVGSPTLFQILTEVRHQKGFKVSFKDALQIGLAVLKHLKVLHECGFSLGNLGLNNLTFTQQEEQKLVICDFSQIQKYQQKTDTNLLTKAGMSHSQIYDIIDLFYLLSNLLRPDLYAGFQQRIDSRSYDLRFTNGKIIFPDAPKQLHDTFDFTLFCKQNQKKLSYQFIMDSFQQLAQQMDINLENKFEFGNKILQKSVFKYEDNLVLNQEQLKKLMQQIESLERSCKNQIFTINLLAALNIGILSKQLQVEVSAAYLKEFLQLDSYPELSLVQSLKYIQLLKFQVLDIKKPLGQQFMRRIDTWLANLNPKIDEQICFLINTPLASNLNLKLKLFLTTQPNQTIRQSRSLSAIIQPEFNFRLDSNTIRHAILKEQSQNKTQDIVMRIQKEENKYEVQIERLIALEVHRKKSSRKSFNYNSKPSPKSQLQESKTNKKPLFIQVDQKVTVENFDDQQSGWFESNIFETTEREFEVKVQKDMQEIEVSLEKMDHKMKQIKGIQIKETALKFKRKNDQDHC